MLALIIAIIIPFIPLLFICFYCYMEFLWTPRWWARKTGLSIVKTAAKLRQLEIMGKVERQRENGILFYFPIESTKEVKKFLKTP
jgi:hypothetical protein